MDRLLRQDDKTVLVVGGTSGIGNGIARAFAQLGAKVHVTGTKARKSDYYASLGSDLSGLEFHSIDAASDADVRRLAENFEELDILILAQGVVEYKRAEYEIERFRRVVDVNLNSLMVCATAFKRLLANAKGSLIIISSIAAFKAPIGTPAYGASKAGAVMLTRTLGAAWAVEGIRVNGIAPGFVQTKLTEVSASNPSRMHSILSRIPIGRVGTPDDMAAVAAFLASPLARYVVGQTISVDGGLGA